MREQLGLVTRKQLTADGVSLATVERWERGGSLARVGSATFRAPSAPASWDSAVMAACLDLRGVASHLTAAALFELVPRPRQIDVLVPEGRRSRPALGRSSGPPVLVHRTTSLPLADVARVGPVPVTSVARTALNLGALVPRVISPARYAEIIGAAVDGGLARDPWLWWLLEHRRCRGRNGVSALEEVLAYRQRLGPTESWLEREVLRIIEAAGLPLPETQRVIHRRGRSAARVDFIYPRPKAVIEAMGYRFHRTPAEADADAQRSIDLQLQGYKVFPLFARRIIANPESVLSTVREILALPLAA